MKTNIKTAKKFITDKYITSKLNGKGEVKADVDELVKMFKQYANQFIDDAIEEEIGVTDQDGHYFKCVELDDLIKIKQLIK